MSPVCTGESPSCRSILSGMHEPQNLYFVFPFIIYFANILFLCARKPYGGCMHRDMGAHINVII